MTAEKTRYVAGVVSAVVSSATFGLIPLFAVPLLDAGIEVNTILFYRFVIAVAVFGLILLFRRVNFRVTFRQAAYILMLGLLYSATSLWLLNAYQYIPAGVATTINFLYPVPVTLMMVLFYREKFSSALVAAAVVSIAGVAMLTWADGVALNMKGVGMALATVFTYAFYIVGVNRPFLNGVGSSVITFYILLIAAVFFFVNDAATVGVCWISDYRYLFSLVMLALVSTLLSNLTLVLAVKRIGSSATSILGSMEPLTAMAVGTLFLGERITASIAFGVLLIISAVLIVIVKKRP